jgi:hypothetical protein
VAQWRSETAARSLECAGHGELRQMSDYRISDEQLEQLASIDPGEARDELVLAIRKQILVPVEKMRRAFHNSFAVTQDELQKGLLRKLK